MALFWIGFVVLVLGMLALDLGVFNRKPHVIGVREALGWTAVWVAAALIFNVALYFLYEHHLLGIGTSFGHPVGGKQASLEFFTGYVVEKSLSLDNIFVIALIFAYFMVPGMYQHRVLFWGVLGALVLRGAMIAAGTALIHRFDWIVYVFGGLLIFTAAKMLMAGEQEIEPRRNPLVRLARRLYPVSADFEGHRFFTRVGGRRAITPLFLVLLLVESTDVLFAVDSIPAIFAVTRDPFIVFTSNVFAILGLRSLYFALAGVLDRFRYLKISLVFLLAYVGVKMILSHHYPIPTPVSLAVICGILAVGVLASVIAARPSAPRESPHEETGGTCPPAAAEREAPAPPPDMLWRQARRIVIFVIGATVVLIGLAMFVLPGPGVVTVLLGLALLATEFVWARRLLRRVRHQADALRDGGWRRWWPRKRAGSRDGSTAVPPGASLPTQEETYRAT